MKLCGLKKSYQTAWPKDSEVKKTLLLQYFILITGKTCLNAFLSQQFVTVITRLHSHNNFPLLHNMNSRISFFWKKD